MIHGKVTTKCTAKHRYARKEYSTSAPTVHYTCQYYLVKFFSFFLSFFLLRFYDLLLKITSNIKYRINYLKKKKKGKILK